MSGCMCVFKKLFYCIVSPPTYLEKFYLTIWS